MVSFRDKIIDIEVPDALRGREIICLSQNYEKLFFRLEDTPEYVFPDVNQCKRTVEPKKICSGKNHNTGLKIEESCKKIEIYTHDNTQVILGTDNATIKGTQNNIEEKEADSVLKKIKSIKENKIYYRKIIVLTAFIACILFCLIFFSIYYFNKYSKYNYFMNKASSLKRNYNFTQAAEEYHNASEMATKLIFNRGLYVKAVCLECDCYMMVAIKETDKEVARQYFAKAGGKYSEVINDGRNKDTDFYVDALAGLSDVYSYTEHILDDEWGTLINLILEETEKMDEIDTDAKDIKNNDDELICHWISAYSALVGYYYTGIETDYSFMCNPFVTYTALAYCEKYDNLLNFLKEKDKEIDILIDSIELAKTRAELMILVARSPYTKNPDQFAKQAIDLCQSYLTDASYYIKNNMENYITLKKFLADGYRILAGDCSAESQKSNEYMKLAYDELSPLLDIEGENIELDQIVDVGYSAIFTGYCSEEELKEILDSFQELLLQSSISENPKKIAWYAIGICDACKYIIENYEYSQQEALEMGKQVSGDVKNIEEYVQGSQKVFFNEFYNYFNQDIREVEGELIHDNIE